MKSILNAIILLMGTVGVASAQSPGRDYDALTPAQKYHADDIMAFIGAMEERFLAHVERYNGSLSPEVETLSFDTADYEILVARGPVVEKAGVMSAVVTAPLPPYLGEPRWNRSIFFDVHPKTPHVPMLHLTMVFQYMADGTGTVGGWMDVLPAVWHEDDLAEMRERMNVVFNKHEVDPAPHRQLVVEGNPEEIDRTWRRKPAGVGGSFYGPPAILITDGNVAFIKEAFETLLEAYFTVLDKRKNDPISADAIAAQDRQRKTWLQDQLFSDPFSSALVPYEAWSLSNAPPVVKF